MRIEQLMYLVDIAQTKSISKTAQNFYITQQGVSDAVKKLEKEFDATLIQRTKYGVLLTQMGHLFVDEGQKILAIYHDLKDHAESFNNSSLAHLDGDLLVLAHPRIYQHILPSVTQTFCQHCPNVKLHIIESKSNAYLENCYLKKPADFRLITTSENTFNTVAFHELYTQARLSLTSLFVDDMIICVHYRSPFAQKNSFTIDDLLALPVITYEYDFVEFPDRTTNATFFTSNNIEVHKKFIQQGMAVDVMTKFEFKRTFNHDPNFIAIPLKKERLVIALVTSSQKALSPEAEHFVSLLRKFSYT